MGVNKENELLNSQIKQVEHALFAVMTSLHKLAPHPDTPQTQGPAFVQADEYFAPDAEYDSVLGSLLIESTLGGAFTAAASGIGWDDVFDCVSQFMQDRTKPAETSFTLGRKRAISNAFNTNSHNINIAAYWRDLPRRLGMERWVAESQRKLYALKKHAEMGLAA